MKTSTCSSKLDPSQSVYYLKRFQWRGEHIQIVTQNENGPCPLLAIANVLVLSKRISLPSVQECITGNQLMEHIGDYILSSGPQVFICIYLCLFVFIYISACLLFCTKFMSSGYYCKLLQLHFP